MVQLSRDVCVDALEIDVLEIVDLMGHEELYVLRCLINGKWIDLGEGSKRTVRKMRRSLLREIENKVSPYQSFKKRRGL